MVLSNTTLYWRPHRRPRRFQLGSVLLRVLQIKRDLMLQSPRHRALRRRSQQIVHAAHAHERRGPHLRRRLTIRCQNHQTLRNFRLHDPRLDLSRPEFYLSRKTCMHQRRKSPLRRWRTGFFVCYNRLASLCAADQTTLPPQSSAMARAPSCGLNKYPAEDMKSFRVPATLLSRSQ